MKLYKIVWVNEKNEAQGCGDFILAKSAAQACVNAMNLRYPEIKHQIQGDCEDATEALDE